MVEATKDVEHGSEVQDQVFIIPGSRSDRAEWAQETMPVKITYTMMGTLHEVAEMYMGEYGLGFGYGGEGESVMRKLADVGPKALNLIWADVQHLELQGREVTPYGDARNKSQGSYFVLHLTPSELSMLEAAAWNVLDVHEREAYHWAAEEDYWDENDRRIRIFGWNARNRAIKAFAQKLGKLMGQLECTDDCDLCFDWDNEGRNFHRKAGKQVEPGGHHLLSLSVPEFYRKHVEPRYV